MPSRKCAQCGAKHDPSTMKIAGLKAFCNQQCQDLFISANKDKLITKGKEIKRKEAKKAKRDYYRKNVSWQHKQTQPVFNKMRRLQELLWYLSRGLEPVCISCQKPLGNDVWACGHLVTVGSNSRLRYDKRNTHLQHNMRCNSALAGDVANQKKNLHLRYGEEEAKEILEYLETNNKPKNWHWEELENMRKEFNAEIRRLEKELEVYM